MQIAWFLNVQDDFIALQLPTETNTAATLADHPYIYMCVYVCEHTAIATLQRMRGAAKNSVLGSRY